MSSSNVSKDALEDGPLAFLESSSLSFLLSFHDFQSTSLLLHVLDAFLQHTTSGSDLLRSHCRTCSVSHSNASVRFDHCDSARTRSGATLPGKLCDDELLLIDSDTARTNDPLMFILGLADCLFTHPQDVTCAASQSDTTAISKTDPQRVECCRSSSRMVSGGPWPTCSNSCEEHAAQGKGQGAGVTGWLHFFEGDGVKSTSASSSVWGSRQQPHSRRSMGRSSSKILRLQSAIVATRREAGKLRPFFSLLQSRWRRPKKRVVHEEDVQGAQEWNGRSCATRSWPMQKSVSQDANRGRAAPTSSSRHHDGQPSLSTSGGAVADSITSSRSNVRHGPSLQAPPQTGDFMCSTAEEVMEWMHDRSADGHPNRDLRARGCQLVQHHSTKLRPVCSQSPFRWTKRFSGTQQARARGFIDGSFCTVRGQWPSRSQVG